MLLTVASARMNAITDAELPTWPRLTIFDGLILTSPVYYGVNSSDKGSGIKMSTVFDMQAQGIFLPDIRGTNDGFNCTSEINCNITDVSRRSCFGFPRAFYAQCFRATVPLRLDESKAESPLSNFANISIFVPDSKTSWNQSYNNSAVMGLGPNSPFWSYINNAYTVKHRDGHPSFEVSLSHPFDRSADIIDYHAKPSDYAASQVVINGRRYSGGKTLRYTNATNDTVGYDWAIKNSRIRVSNLFDFPSASACVDPLMNRQIIVPSDRFAAIISMYANLLCGSIYINACTRLNSDISRVEPIQVTLTDSSNNVLDLVIKPAEFISWDANGRAWLAIAQHSDSEYCDSEIGFGRLFLSNFEYTVSSSGQATDASPTLELMYLYDSGIGTADRFAALVLGLLGLAAAVGLGVYTGCFGLKRGGFSAEQNGYSAVPV